MEKKCIITIDWTKNIDNEGYDMKMKVRQNNVSLMEILGILEIAKNNFINDTLVKVN